MSWNRLGLSDSETLLFCCMSIIGWATVYGRVTILWKYLTEKMPG